MVQKDIFTEIQAKIGCVRRSELPYHKREVWQEIKKLPLSAYPQEQLEDFSHYVFGVDYSVLVGILTELKGRDLTNV
ncbi:TPA: hypothetical protein LR738_000642 [Clostridioides difficile]|nr:hypothetical protein [[Clostridium] innocuum]HBL6275422.1 hypothetical protein [Clostridioides difficile]